jgi:plasmid stability protein
MTATTFKIPSHLIAWLKERATANHRSMNKELISILEQLAKGGDIL